MRGVDTPYLNAVSQILVKDAITYYAGPFNDTTVPAISINQTQNEMYVTGRVELTGTASDDHGVGWIDVWDNNSIQNTYYTASYVFNWFTGTVPGSHTLTAKAHDTAGNISESAITLIVCPGDANRDGILSISDFQIVKDEFGRSCTSNSPCRADFNGDNLVNTSDFNIYRQYHGTSCRPTPTP